MLKSFRSSDKKSTEGIEFGDEWYKVLMTKLDAASDVVCLLTERSLDRPWILYEAGAAKGKMGTQVHGLALGIPLSRASTGPFYQFQNSDDSEESVAKLVLQLCRRVQGLEPEMDVVKAQVKTFKLTVTDVLKDFGVAKKAEKKEPVDEAAVAKVLEEMKLLVRELPLHLEQRIINGPERLRQKRFRMFVPAIDKISHMLSRRSNDPIGILLIASFVREDFPWLYEIGMEAYRTAKLGKPEVTQEALETFGDAAEVALRGSFMKEFGLQSDEARMVLMDLPALIDHYKHQILEKEITKKLHPRSRLKSVDGNESG